MPLVQDGGLEQSSACVIGIGTEEGARIDVIQVTKLAVATVDPFVLTLVADIRNFQDRTPR